MPNMQAYSALSKFGLKTFKLQLGLKELRMPTYARYHFLTDVKYVMFSVIWGYYYNRFAGIGMGRPIRIICTVAECRSLSALQVFSP